MVYPGGAPQPRLRWPARRSRIWFDEGDPLQDAPAETRFFRRTFTVARPGDASITEAALDATADNAFTVWLNGVEVGSGDDWMVVKRRS